MKNIGICSWEIFKSSYNLLEKESWRIPLLILIILLIESINITRVRKELNW